MFISCPNTVSCIPLLEDHSYVVFFRERPEEVSCIDRPRALRPEEVKSNKVLLIHPVIRPGS